MLTGRGLPPWINRLAYVSSCVPFLERCLPREMLTPNVLEESVRERVFAEREPGIPPGVNGGGLTAGGHVVDKPSNSDSRTPLNCHLPQFSLNSFYSNL